MVSLRLVCAPGEADTISAELWEAGTVGIRELHEGDSVVLIAGFEETIAGLAERLRHFQPLWEREEETDWTMATKLAWPGRLVGERIFLAPPWNEDRTPAGRVRVVHNPGLASGTGEHPCTQLALEALEKSVYTGTIVADIGTGSGILAISSLRLGAKFAVAIDTDEAALQTARENFELNQLPANLAAGSADCIASGSIDILVANISGSVLVAIADELIRVTKNDATLILTGFPESELTAMQSVFGNGEVTALNEWRCLSY
jgi:ribosomal protein L11 methyltransferase